MPRAAPLLALLAGAAVAQDARDAVRVVRESVLRVDADTRRLTPELEALFRGLGGVDRRPGAVVGQRGTGVVVAGGALVTSHHVVAGAVRIRVTDAAGEQVPADVVEADADLDLALVRPRLPVGVPARFGWSSGVEVGAPVLTLGFPAGEEVVVSQGVLAGRTVRGLEGRSRRDWLLTDALVQRGVSGGPLVTGDGAVIGLASGGYERGSGAEGLGLVLPAEAVVARLEAWEQAAPGRALGLGLRAVGDALEVVRVDPEGAAAAAGIVVGERIVAVDARPVVEARRLVDHVVSAPEVGLHLPSGEVVRVSTGPTRRTEPDWRWREVGLVAGAAGAVVVDPGGPGRRMGLDPGDRITAVGDAPVATLADLQRVVAGRWEALVLTVAGKGFVLLPSG